MLDVNTPMRQEDLNRKTNLLKQIKISIESLMFESNRTTNRWQNMGVLSILSRQILAILEDGLLNDSVVSDSPSVHSRSTTLSSLGAYDLNTDLDQVLWSFILTIFTSDNQILTTSSNSNLPHIARKDFESIHNQIKSNKQNEIDQSTEDTCVNLPLCWIKSSLRQSILLNQLVYLTSDSTRIEKYFQSNAFLLDREFVNDFLKFIKACETRDYSILKKIKCKFFTPNLDLSRSPGAISSSVVNQDKNNRSSSSSYASSLTSQTNQLTNGTPNEMASSPTNSSVLTNSENSSLIELAINEVNLSNKYKQTHRRMHSFPNIQINEAKRKLITASNTLNKSFHLNGDLDSKDNDLRYSLSSKIEESKLENRLSTSTLLINNHLEENTIKEKSDLNNNNSSTNTNVNPSEIYEKTTVFDFIHSQQINCDCSQVDKENSHFIIADIAIAAFELIKTQDLDDSTDLDEDVALKPNDTNLNVNFLTVNKTSTIKRQATRLKSNGIKINRNQNSQLFNIPFSSSPFNNSSEDYASSVEREVFYASGCTSPNVETLSSTSIVVSQEQQPPKRGHKKSLSLVSHIVSNTKSLSVKPTLFKSFSSNNLTTNEVIQETENTKSTDTILLRVTSSSDLPTPNQISLSSSPNENPNLLNRNISTNTLGSQVSNRTRRFSWEEIVNLDTAEHIANRLIEKLVEVENQRKKNDPKLKLTQAPNLKQFENFIQFLEIFEYMQIYYEMRSSGLLTKYINALAVSNAFRPASTLHMSASSIYLSHSDSPKQIKQSQAKINTLLSEVSKSFNKSFNSSIISKIKIAAVAAAATVSSRQFNLEQQKSKSSDSDEIEHKNNSFNLQDSMSLLSQNKDSLTSEELISSTSLLAFSNSMKTLNPRILGDESWAPVRDQLILNQTPKMKRLDQMILQDFRCAECGIRVRKDKMKSFNYCEYFCKYFCRCCHINNQSYIPAYIVNSLDFRTKYEVSKKAKNFLEKIYNEPVITLESLNPSLYERTNIFSKFKKVRCKLYNCRQYINSCRFAIDLKKQLYNQFEDFIINDSMVYSIETLFKIKQTNYYETMKQLVQQCMDHIRMCELCSQQGYICGLCTNNELLYPFELEKVQKCENCLACCHKTCLKKPELCPRCKRKQNRMRLNSSNTGTTISVTNE